jgi:hypothetical protein
MSEMLAATANRSERLKPQLFIDLRTEADCPLTAQYRPSMFRARAGERKAAIRKLFGLNERQQC